MTNKAIFNMHINPSPMNIVKHGISTHITKKTYLTTTASDVKSEFTADIDQAKKTGLLPALLRANGTVLDAHRPARNHLTHLKQECA